MEKYVVYITTNLINGKKYIGSHIIKKDNDNYLGSGVNLKKALNKYGKNNFNREILGYTNNPKDMKELEEYYLDYYNCVTSNIFYNATKYSSGITYNTWGDKIRETNKGNKYNLGRPMSEFTKLQLKNSVQGKSNMSEKGRSIVKLKNLGNKYALGNKFSQESKNNLGRNHQKIILQYDLEGNFIREWPSLRTAAYEVLGNRLHSGISTCCNGKQKHCGGFIWKFKFEGI